MKKRSYQIVKTPTGHCVHFDAMASPCEVLVESDDVELVTIIAKAVSLQTWAIEDKFSRYNPDSVCSLINQSCGEAVAIDNETFLMLQFANQCFEISDGKFDISSGLLRQEWTFDGGEKLPSHENVAALVSLIGWNKVVFDQHSITLPQGMELDFGGIGKEYAVDKAILLIKELTMTPTLVNFGGDLAVTSARKDDQQWQVGVELVGLDDKPTVVISFLEGAVATSGDAKRYLEKDGKRYSHILDPHTGWPVELAARSITVASSNCVNAGMIATLAMLQGQNAEAFLTENDIKHWIYR